MSSRDEQQYWQVQGGKPAYPYVRGFLKDYLPPPARLLDVGCGSGRVSIELATAGYQVDGIDLNSTALNVGKELALQKKATIKWHEADARHLPFEDGSFDGVLLVSQFLSQFHGRDSRMKILLEAHRVLKPRGLLLLSFQNRVYDPGFFHALHYVYCRVFIYPAPEITPHKFATYTQRILAHLKSKWEFFRTPGLRRSRDLYAVTSPPGLHGETVPFHDYRLKEMIQDLGQAGFEIHSCRDTLDFEKQITLPTWLVRGAPCLAIAARRI